MLRNMKQTSKAQGPSFASMCYFVCLCPLAFAAVSSWARVIFKYETVLIFSVCSVPNPWFITCSIHI